MAKIEGAEPEVTETTVTPITKARKPAPVKTTVTMQRYGEGYKPPHTAEVHPDEVDNWAKHGWERAD
jgi:hypothetical protein